MGFVQDEELQQPSPNITINLTDNNIINNNNNNNITIDLTDNNITTNNNNNNSNNVAAELAARNINNNFYAHIKTWGETSPPNKDLYFKVVRIKYLINNKNTNKNNE